MDEGDSTHPTETPEGSAGDDTLQSNNAKNAAMKDRKCQYCHQAFTSSSLGRHLDQFLFKKKPDGIHDVEEIRRIRSGITRRQARTSSGKRDSPDGARVRGQADGDGASSVGGNKTRESGFRMMFNTPTWHATGVINDIPNPSRPQDRTSSTYLSSNSQSRMGTLGLPDYSSRGASANVADTARALELALREVLDNIRAATSTKSRPRLSPFDFDLQSQTFPSLCLLLLPPPPSLFSAHPFPSAGSFPLQPPGAEHLEIVRQALHSKIEKWESDQTISGSGDFAKSSAIVDLSMIQKSAQQHEEMCSRHVELAFKHWISLPPETRREVWQLEITRAFAREAEKRENLDSQLARVQQEANQLREQVERLGSCQWPREFALFPPDTLPIPRDVARELDSRESALNPDSRRWDYDNILAKWKRVVMHDRGMGRVGVGQPQTLPNEYSSADTKSHVEDTGNVSRTPNPPAAPSPDQNSPTITHRTVSPPILTSRTSPPSMYPDANRSPKLSHQAKRQRLINGYHGAASQPEGDAASSAGRNNVPGTSSTWNSH
ncbi:hypothetical protein ASPZODRAFT_69894 [Penicilliopsis zonata CBS 506.65]|uniref:Uncharacterized protein n=1 Tax=Penicilliopsis zonata CBS 506.65 TaxID=1073090 RepID=A0A1L9SE27_9EURO|nr:hypothetical protein ASPZODRAFT_69894 [Penicilliopsis zonata CBS 506.65]OJJ45431.1 hypothetical protein ASPZODRAFT_69894 [Penicilliopsis zonata CBS 506.65]